jgi:hypothetical protein
MRNLTFALTIGLIVAVYRVDAYVKTPPVFYAQCERSFNRADEKYIFLATRPISRSQSESSFGGDEKYNSSPGMSSWFWLFTLIYEGFMVHFIFVLLIAYLLICHHRIGCIDPDQPSWSLFDSSSSETHQDIWSERQRRGNEQVLKLLRQCSMFSYNSTM